MYMHVYMDMWINTRGAHRALRRRRYYIYASMYL